MTPELVRKTSRFREIFKRSSASPKVANSSDNIMPDRLQLSSPTSPLSPTVKWGFEQVGLLPSERSLILDATKELESHGGSNLAEVLARQEEEVKAVGMPHNIDMIWDISHAIHANKAAEDDRQETREAEANVIADAFQDALAKHQEEHAEGEPDLVEGQSSPLGEKSVNGCRGSRSGGDAVRTGPFRPSAVQNDTDSDEEPFSFPRLRTKPAYNNLSSNSGLFGTFSGVGTFGDDCQVATDKKIGKDGGWLFKDVGKKSVGGEAPRRTTPHVEMDEQDLSDRPSHRSSCTSNIFDNEDSLSQGIREYVSSKIAEAIAAFEQKHSAGCMPPDTTESSVVGPKQVNLNIKISSSGTSAETIEPSTSLHSPQQLLRNVKKLGPFPIRRDGLATRAQSAIAIAYIGLILVAALRGRTCLLWMVCNILTYALVYAIMMWRFGFIRDVNDLTDDVFVAPVFNCAIELVEETVMAVRKVVMEAVFWAVAALKEADH
ncbi:hypothetical protein EK21DRAFT_111974 [Setomelanomma holmii]|uniref:Uncharacterized protein n=1 Tax=Setomelanomma holmii TaxID=210430 RepID=A0A9P4LKJ5_9PLEO|nr:hypothetical protein EK21DRAFT_111974 [Setomelanomma holmii]